MSLSGKHVIEMDSSKDDQNSDDSKIAVSNINLLKENTFVIPNDVPPRKPSSRDLKHRKALTLAKANARQELKSLQKRLHWHENDVKNKSGSGRPFIQHISEAMRNESGEKIYFRWEEAGKVMKTRQPKAVSKLYDYKRKRLAKKKINSGGAASKSAPNRAGQNASVVETADDRIKTAATTILVEESDQSVVDRDSTEDIRPSLKSRDNQTRRGKRVEFDIPPHRFHGVREAFLSNSAKSQNSYTSANRRRNAHKLHPSQQDVPADPEQNPNKGTPDGLTDSDKENATSQATPQASPLDKDSPTFHLDDTKARRKLSEPKQQQGKTLGRGQSRENVLPTVQWPAGAKTSSATAVPFTEPKPPTVANSSKAKLGDSKYRSTNDKTSKLKRTKSEQLNSEKLHGVNAVLLNNGKEPSSLAKASSSLSDVTKRQSDQEIDPVRKKSTSNFIEKSKNPVMLKANVLTNNDEPYRDKNCTSNPIVRHQEKPEALPNAGNESAPPLKGDDKNKYRFTKVQTKTDDTIKSSSESTDYNRTTKKRLYRNMETVPIRPPQPIDKSTDNILTNSSSSTTYDLKNTHKSDYRAKRQNSIDGGHLKTIIEGLPETSCRDPHSIHNKDQSTGLVLKSNKTNVVRGSVIHHTKETAFIATNGIDYSDPVIMEDQEEDDDVDAISNPLQGEGKVTAASTSHQNQAARDYSLSGDLTDSSRLSVSWPKTNRSMKKNEKRGGGAHAHAVGKPTPSHRLNLITFSHSSDGDSPPISINRYNMSNVNDRVNINHSSGTNKTNNNSNNKNNNNNNNNNINNKSTSSNARKTGKEQVTLFDAVDQNDESLFRNESITTNVDGSSDKVSDNRDSKRAFQPENHYKNCSVTLDARASTSQAIHDHIVIDSDGKTDLLSGRLENGIKPNHQSDGQITSTQHKTRDFFHQKEQMKSENRPGMNKSGFDPVSVVPRKDKVVKSDLQDAPITTTMSDGGNYNGDLKPVGDGRALKSNHSQSLMGTDIGSHQMEEDKNLTEINSTGGVLAGNDVISSDPEGKTFARPFSERPLTAGMSRFLDRPSVWNEDNEDAMDDDIKFINDEKDFYEVFGYDADTTEILRSTRIFPVSNFQNIESTKHARDSNHNLTSGKSDDDIRKLGQRAQTKLKPKRVSHVNSRGFIEKKYPIGQDNKNLYASDKAESLAIPPDIGKSLYKTGYLAKDGNAQNQKKIFTNEDVLLSTSSSSPSSSQASPHRPVGILVHRNGNSQNQNGFPVASGPTQGIASDKDKDNMYHRRLKNKSLEGVYVDPRPVPVNDMHVGKIPKPPMTNPSEQTTVTGEKHWSQRGHGKTLHISRPVMHYNNSNNSNNNNSNNTNSNYNSIKDGRSERRRILNETDTDKQNLDLSITLNITAAKEKKTFVAAVLKQPTRPLSNDATQPALYPKVEPKDPPPLRKDSNPMYGTNAYLHQPRGALEVIDKEYNSGKQPHEDFIKTFPDPPTKPSMANYNKATDRIRTRILEQNNQKLNNDSKTGIDTKNNPFPTDQYSVLPMHDHKRPQAITPSIHTIETHVGAAMAHKPLRDTTHQDRHSFASTQVADQGSLAKPRKLKPIIHHPGMQKRHQHLTSGL